MKPEAHVPEPREPGQKRLAALDRPRHRVLTRDVPSHLRRDQAPHLIEVAGAEGVSSSSVGDRVGVLPRHRQTSLGAA
jgi:hypothetical protein